MGKERRVGPYTRLIILIKKGSLGQSACHASGERPPGEAVPEIRGRWATEEVETVRMHGTRSANEVP